jgi:hypothetical protein
MLAQRVICALGQRTAHFAPVAGIHDPNNPETSAETSNPINCTHQKIIKYPNLPAQPL